MNTTLTRKKSPVLSAPGTSPASRSVALSASGGAPRAVRILQSSRAPAQLSLFLRPSAIDGK